MPSLPSFAVYSLVTLIFAMSQCSSQTNNGTLIWTPCSNFADELAFGSPNVVPSNITCYRFQVPLDWHNASVGNAQLAVAKLNATGEKQGVIFINPGGPGDPALVELVISGAQFVNAIGDQFDVITWDPRGVGLSFPGNFEEIHSSITDFFLYWNNTVEITGIDYTGNFTNQTDINDLYANADFMDQKYRQFSQSLVDGYGDLVKYAGTVATARDLAALADAFDTPGAPVNYWGFSYGSLLGAYFANLFPGRVGRIILDGVVNVLDMSEKEPFRTTADNWENSDEAFGALANACAQAGPSVCNLTREGWSGADVVAYLHSALTSIHDISQANPQEVDLFTTDNQVTSGIVRVALFNAAYGGGADESLQTTLNEIIGGLLSAWSDFTNGSFVYPPSNLNSSSPSSSMTKRNVGTGSHLEPRVGIDSSMSRSNIVILCGDSVDGNPNVTMKNVFDQIVNVTQNVSPMFGGVWYQGYYCPFWPVRAVERYMGPFNTTLKNPVLLIGNQADPITPFIGAQAVANAMGSNAVLIEEKSFGHTSLAERSQCVLDIVRSYLVNGTLPSNDSTICNVDPTFQVLPGVSGNTVQANITAGGGLVPSSDGVHLGPWNLTPVILVLTVLVYFDNW